MEARVRGNAQLFDRLGLVMLLVLLVHVGWAGIAFSAPGAPPVLTEPAASSNIDALLAGMSDEQVRQLLIEELRKESETEASPVEAGKGPVAVLGRLLNKTDVEIDGTSSRLLHLWEYTPQIIPEMKSVLIPFFVDGAWSSVGALFLILVVSYGAEMIFRRLFCAKQLQTDITYMPDQAGLAKFLAAAVNILPRVIGLIVFLCSGVILFSLGMGDGDDSLRVLFLACLIALGMFRSLSLFSLLFCSPSFPNFRLLPLADEGAKSLHRVMLGSFGYIIFSLMSVVFLMKMQISRDSAFVLLLMIAAGLLLAAAIVVLLSRRKVEAYLLRSSAPDGGQSWAQVRFASVWHVLAITYLLVLFLFLLADISDPGRKGNGAFLISFFIGPIFLVMDKLVQWVVGNGLKILKLSHADTLADGETVDDEAREERATGRLLTQKVERIARFGLFLALSIWLASLWGIQIPFVSQAAGAIFDIIIVLTFALLFWRFISSYIERKMLEDQPEEEEDPANDDEWGGAAARGRAYTLLPMVRKFIGTTLLVMVILIVFSSIGVDIGPLLAGAGVVGLAIGFGAQKMVSDIFSGFFYLMDDAFRVGEYLTAGSVSGMVESITLRNVMLRHHRGMLQIVPHSELGAITNFMRGGIVVKFNLDFPYDTDIDKVRKVIKKVGQAMLEDEELGKDFIQPVKSQGVRSITNSVMTIRVKFTAHPGGQFVIRREAFRRITEALAAKGIHYAHKKVIVEMPQEVLALAKGEGSEKMNGSQDPQRQALAAAGAAAMAAVSEDEEKAADTKEEKPGMPGI